MTYKQSSSIIILLLLLGGSYAEVDSDEQAKSALDVIGRVLPYKADYFRVTVDFSLPKNHYEIIANRYVNIRASSGVAAVRGFYDYIRKVHKGQVAWEGSQLELDSFDVEYQFNATADSEVIYFQNVCTFGYTYAWWTFEDWQKHIDWIAMHGINLVLAPFQEDVWKELYKEWGMNDEEIDQHFSGPAFLPWQRMANLRGFGGPLSDHFLEHASQLQQKVIHEYQRLGIKFALPSFAGHVPLGFKRIFPETNFQNTSRWMNFPIKFCCPLSLDPTDPLFHRIGTEFLTKMIERYGTSHVYFADPYNELTPPSKEPTYLANVSKAIFKVMETVDSSATWFLQGWMFYNKQAFWQQPQLEAFLTAIPIGRMLVLDLHSDQRPQYDRTKSYYGQPFIWGNMHNSGGSIENHGSAGLVAERARNAFNNKNLSMVGVGAAPEGINQNHVVYEITMDVAWGGKSEIDTKKWFKQYGSNRYGRKWAMDAKAWETLHDTVYNYNGLKHVGGMTPAPSMVNSPGTKIKTWSYYHPHDIRSVVEELLTYTNEDMNELYDYDVVDFTRQYLQNMMDIQYIALVESYKNNSLTDVQNHSELFLNMISDVDRLLGTNRHFLLGNWIESARFLGATPEEKDRFEYNARNQVTIWGPNGEINNYGIKQWAGLIKDYLYPRWSLFLTELIEAMKNGETLNEGATRQRIRKNIEFPFQLNRTSYSTETDGRATLIAREILLQYKDVHIEQRWLDQYMDP